MEVLKDASYLLTKFLAAAVSVAYPSLLLIPVVEWLEEGPQSLSSLKKEFSKETKIVK